MNHSELFVQGVLEGLEKRAEGEMAADAGYSTPKQPRVPLKEYLQRAGNRVGQTVKAHPKASLAAGVAGGAALGVGVPWLIKKLKARRAAKAAAQAAKK